MKLRILQIEDSNNIVKDFKSIILKIIDARFGKMFDYSLSNKDFILSAVTLPRFKVNFILYDADKFFVKNLLITECKLLCSETDGTTDIVPILRTVEKQRYNVSTPVSGV